MKKQKLDFYFNRSNNGEFNLISFDDKTICVKHINCGLIQTKSRQVISAKGVRCENIKCIFKKVSDKVMIKYGVDNMFKLKEIKENAIKLSCSKESKDKRKKTMIQRYGTEHALQNKDLFKKSKITLMNNFGVSNPTKSKIIIDKIKKTNLIKYGVTSYMKLDYFKNKMFTTKKSKGNYSKSSAEDIMFLLLQEKFGNTQRQHKTEKYPFNCDFYIEKYDIYIEYNGLWTHGDGPFDPTLKKHLDRKELFEKRNTKYYIDSLTTWCIRDPLKRITAKKNNLILVEIWPKETEQQIINKIEEAIASSKVV